MLINISIPGLFSLACLVRLVSLSISIFNERKLRLKNAIEYGKGNSIVLVLFHTLFYLVCLGEAVLLEKQFNGYSIFGLALFIFSMIALGIVIYQLRGIWTVKLIIAPDQNINRSFIFKYFRHPNYFLNIIPELVSIAFMCQAWRTLLIGLPVYFFPLTLRIFQEEKIMKKHFGNY